MPRTNQDLTPSAQIQPMQTKMPTRTKALIITAAIFALGLAAYGFGLLPLFPEEERTTLPDRVFSCREKCQNAYCFESKEGYACDKEKYASCLDMCEKEETQPFEETGAMPGGYGIPGYAVPGYGVPGYAVPGYSVPMEKTTEKK